VPPDFFSALFAELGRLSLLDRLERELRRRGYRYVAGVDEVGRGSLAGPVVAAAVILPEGWVLPGLDDSKRLDSLERERIAAEVRRMAVGLCVGLVGCSDIDMRDILRASLEAMKIAVDGLRPEPDAVLVDAVSIPGLRRPQLPVVHGDALCASVAAASIVAKVHRDKLMDELACRYPAYGFERHRGYGTSDHWKALRLYGPCPEHRLSYHGVVGGIEPEPLIPSRGARKSKARVAQRAFPPAAESATKGEIPSARAAPRIGSGIGKRRGREGARPKVGDGRRPRP
jgi:ribonuclease HII